MSKEYVVRLIWLSGTTKDVLTSSSKDKAEQYIAASKLRRPRVRHQLGTRRVFDDYGFVCAPHSGGGLGKWQGQTS